MFSVLFLFCPCTTTIFVRSEQALYWVKYIFMRRPSSILLIILFDIIFLKINTLSFSCYVCCLGKQATNLHLLKSTASEHKFNLLSDTGNNSKLCQKSKSFNIMCAEHADNHETGRRIANSGTMTMSQSAPDATLLMRARKKPRQVC